MVRRGLDLRLSQMADLTLPQDGLRGQIELAGTYWLVCVFASRDRPGRRFPLAIMCRFAADDLVAANVWCDQVTPIAQQARDAGSDADALMAALPPAPQSQAPDRATEIFWHGQTDPGPAAQIFRTLSSD